MVFRGNFDRLYVHSNGNFLDKVQLFAKFHLIMVEHLRRIQNSETMAHYLEHESQNELISLISNRIL